MRGVERPTISQFRTKPEEQTQDLARQSFELGTLFERLKNIFDERWTLRKGSLTARSVVRFGEATKVNTVSADVPILLPKATTRDAGRRIVLIKTTPDNAMVLQSSEGANVNTFGTWTLTQLGLHEIWWDGAAWWAREPRAQVRRHDTTHGPLGLWQFDTFSTAGTDTSGNSLDLTLEAGTKRTTHIHPGLEGIYLDGSSAWYESTGDSSLRLTGDLTFECLFALESVVAGAYWFSHMASGELEADNQLYGMRYSSGSSPAFDWIQESGAGTNATYTFGNYYMIPGQLCHVALTRTSGVLQAYLNGRRWGDPSSALTTPTGGASGRFRVGADASTRTKGTFASVKLVGSALTTAQIRAEFNRTMGPAFGFMDEAA